MAEPDLSSPQSSETRQRLIDAAGPVFAEFGYQQATVREICERAQANVAAVNYHFGDKLGLYTEVLVTSKCLLGQAAASQMTLAGSPEEQMERFILEFLRNLLSGGQPTWQSRLMAQEMNNPTPALARVLDVVIRPTHDRLWEILLGILGPNIPPEQMRACIHSIVAQCTHYARSRGVLAELWPELKMTPDQIHFLAKHIAQFSLGGLRAIIDSSVTQPDQP